MDNLEHDDPDLREVLQSINLYQQTKYHQRQTKLTKRERRAERRKRRREELGIKEPADREGCSRAELREASSWWTDVGGEG